MNLKINTDAFASEKSKIGSRPAYSTATAPVIKTSPALEMSQIPSEVKQPSSNLDPTIIQRAWKSALPNLELVNQQKSSTYMEVAKAIAKDAQSLNSRLGKVTKHVETVGSIIDRLQSDDLKGEMSKTVSKKSFSSGLVSIGSALYFLFVEYFPRLFKLFGSNDSQDD